MQVLKGRQLAACDLVENTEHPVAVHPFDVGVNGEVFCEPRSTLAGRPRKRDVRVMSLVIDLELKNYRCFEDTQPARFRIQPGFTAIVGKNNSGKSTLLRSFFELRHLFEKIGSTELVAALTENHYSAFNVPGSTNAEPLFCDLNDRQIGISIRFSREGWQSDVMPQRVEIEIPRDTNSFKAVCYLPDGRRGEGRPAVVGPGIMLLDGTAISLAYLAEVGRTLTSTLYVGAYRNAINVGGKEDYYDIPVGQAFVKRWKTLLAGATKAQGEATYRLTESIKKIFEFDDLQIHPSADERTLILYINGRQYALSEVGSGLAQFILVMVAAAVRKPDYILLDEPELNLHASLQSDFLMTLGTYASQGVIYCTHNLGLARSSSDKIYSVTRTGSGPSILRPYEATPRLSEFVGALSFSGSPALGFDRILLVESPTDGRAVQQFLRTRGKDHLVLTIPLGGGTLINGTETTEAQLIELKRITPRVAALVDSERNSPEEPLSRERRAFQLLCERQEIKCHVLERRALENYFPQSAIDTALGAGREALSHFDQLPKAAWPKAHNWKIARSMTREALDGTDLGRFLDEL